MYNKDLTIVLEGKRSLEKPSAVGIKRRFTSPYWQVTLSGLGEMHSNSSEGYEGEQPLDDKGLLKLQSM